MKKLFFGIILSFLLVNLLGSLFMVGTSLGSTGVNGKLQKSNLCSQTLSGPPSTEWNKTYGGANLDWAYSLVQTSDGGYAMAGITASFGPGDTDFYLVKTDASGNMQWNQTYGGPGYDEARATSLLQTADGGYAVAGRTGSFGAGGLDAWLVKTDSSGNMQWNMTYGGTGSDQAMALVQTSDGGYAMAGITVSFAKFGLWDFWLVKTDASGNVQWNQTYGRAGLNEAYGLVQTTDGGYALAGLTRGIPDNYSSSLVKTDASGNMQWMQTYGGGAGNDMAYSLVQTSDGGYALAGHTDSFGAGDADLWFVKTDTSGNMQWNNHYGGIGSEDALAFMQTTDGGYMIAGLTSPFGGGVYDGWLVHTDASGNMWWNKTYGGPHPPYGGIGTYYLSALVQTSDGGYALAGVYDSGTNPDFWLIKLAPALEQHDVVVTYVTTSKAGCVPMPTVGQNLVAAVNVTVANVGTFDEGTVTVTVYATPSLLPSIVIGSATVSLNVGQSITLTFTWNTTGFAYGYYTISATVDPVAGETNTGDNTFTDGTVLVTIPGDLNGDGIVDIYDAILLANAYNSTPEKPNWSPNADINGDNIVDIYDAILLANHYGQHYV